MARNADCRPEFLLPEPPEFIIVDGEIISAPIIKTAITGGRAVIAGRFTRAEANRIAEGIMRK